MTKKIKYVEPAEYFPEEFYEQARKEYEEMKKKGQTSIDASQMTSEEIHEKLDKGYQDAVAGRTRDAKEVFDLFRSKEELWKD